MSSRPGGGLPARAGIGLRAEHYVDVLETRPAVAWLEAHPENYFGAGGKPLHYLERARALYPLSLHGVGLSLGSVDELDRDHLRRLKRLVDRLQPGFVSEHVCWGAIDGIHLNDLLPLPYTEEALRHLTSRVSQLQDTLGRPVLLENVSSYLEFTTSEMSEADFLVALAHASGCGLLLDVNNVYVGARNHGFDARAFIAGIPPALVGEIHLAGHSVNEFPSGEMLIDTHSTHVCAAVWELYEFSLMHCGAVPTLIEWDADIPALGVLVAEATAAEMRLERVRAVAA